MSKSNPSQKWAQFGRGGRSRDATFPSASTHVSKDAQANTIDETAVRLVAFNPQNRGQLPERPSTSGGPATKRRIAEKRETKDDLHFNPLTSHGKETTFYNFPLPGSLPTPATSPKDDAPPTPRKSSSPRPSTPESMEVAPTPSVESMDVPQAEIGMALGSPAHPPQAWQQSHIISHATSPSPDHSEAATEEWANSPRAVKQKGKGWKLFGGLFGGKKAVPTGAFYQVQPESSVRAMVDVDGTLAESDKPIKLRGRGRSFSERKAKKDRPDVKRTETAPLDFDFKDHSMSRARLAPTPEITLDGNALINNASKPAQKTSASLLDVNIPDIQMERYSIMFGSVLGKSTNSSSSLLARRQATLEKLKTVNEALAAKEEELNEKAKHLKIRRATSPQIRHSQSPAFSLFPNTPSRKDHSSSRPRNSSSLQRSNTSPAALSPSRPSFAPGVENDGHTILISVDPNTKSPNKPVSPHISSLIRAGAKPTISITSPSKQWTDESRLILDSPGSISVNDEDVYEPASYPLKPKLSEPQWQMVNPNHNRIQAASISESATSSHASSSDVSNSTSVSSVSTPQSAGSIISRPLNIVSTPQSAGSVISRPLNIASPPLSSRSRMNPQAREIPKPRSRSATRIANASAQNGNQKISEPTRSSVDFEDEHSEDEKESRLKTAADVSIARQISVSRQQRQLLVPIKSSSIRRVSPAQKNLGLGATTISVAHVASPLGAVASAAQAERERTASPHSENRERPTVQTRKNSYGQGVERLVESSVKPNTPTLVIVGGEGAEAREQKWATATANLKGSIAERRRLKERNARGLTPVAGVIRGRLTAASAVRGTASDSGHVQGHQYRKSERVVVEEIQ